MAIFRAGLLGEIVGMSVDDLELGSFPNDDIPSIAASSTPFRRDASAAALS